MGVRLAQAGLGRGYILLRRLHRRLIRLQAGDRIILGLFAHDALFGQLRRCAMVSAC